MASHIDDLYKRVMGQAWKAYQDSTADFSYYDSDGFHPSRLDSQVAAQVIVETLLPELDK